jgi:hypothetical protein
MGTNHATEATHPDESGKTVIHSSLSAAKPETKKAIAAKGKSEAKLRARAPGSARGKSAPGKLVCRYCGSDDLAPSFKKRRDARCRACFKKRYGSSKAGRRAAGTDRKTKAAK